MFSYCSGTDATRCDRARALHRARQETEEAEEAEDAEEAEETSAWEKATQEQKETCK